MRIAYDAGLCYGLTMRRINISVTVKIEASDGLHAVTGPKGASSFGNEAVRQRLQTRRLQRLLNEIDEEFGPVSESVAREVDAIAWPAVNKPSG